MWSTTGYKFTVVRPTKTGTNTCGANGVPIVVGAVSVIGGSLTRGDNNQFEPVLWGRDQGQSKACAQPILTAEVTMVFAVTAKGTEG